MKLNQVYEIGNLVKDAEIKVMPNGKTKQVFTLAINDDFKEKGKEDWTHRAYFLDCYVVGKEYKNLTKGKKVLINGKIITRNYEQNGSKKKITLIEVFALDFLVQKDSSEYESVRAEEKGNIKDIEGEADLPF